MNPETTPSPRIAPAPPRGYSCPRVYACTTATGGQHCPRPSRFGGLAPGRAPLLLGLWLLAALVSPAGAVIRDGGIDPANLGKGTWIYAMSDATNKLDGHVSSVTNENSLMLYFKSQGIRWIIVKTASGSTYFNGCYSFPQFTTNLVNTAHANGLLIFGDTRSYGQDIPGESGVADFCFTNGADGFVWDAEQEWETNSNPAAAAWQLCSMTRSNWQNKFIAYNPQAIISVHTKFPYKEFGYWNDAAMPMVLYYFAPKYTPTLSNYVSQVVSWSDANWNYYQSQWAGLPPTNNNGLTVYWTNSIKPVIPMAEVEGPTSGTHCESSGSPFPDKDVMEFLDFLAADPNPATVGGYQGANFFRCDLHDPAQWAYLQAATSGSFPSVVNNIVIDNPKTTTGGSGGAWTNVLTFFTSTPIPSVPRFLGNGSGLDTNSFGTNYMVKSQGTGSAWVQFTPTVVAPGDYNVYQWHPLVTNASASVPHIVTYDGGSTTIYANQQTNDGNWSLLGRFRFASGTAGNVRVTDGIPETTAVAIADGLKLVFMCPTSPPTPPTGLRATAIATNQITLAWTNTATDATGFVIARSTNSGGAYTDIATVSVNGTNYLNTGLALGTTYYYVARATNWLAPSLNSTEATATTWCPPTITTQPHDQIIVQGSNATFSVAATGTPPLSYYWHLWETNSVGTNSPTLTVPNAQTNDTGAYSVVVSNLVGPVTSSNALLTVNVPPDILVQPRSLTNDFRSDATFWITATGTPPLAYQWRCKGEAITSATTSAYTRTNVHSSDAGNYSVVVSNVAGSATSADATLTVLPPAPPNLSITVLPGGQVQLGVSGTPGQYGVEATSNLAEWVELTNLTTTDDTFEYSDPETSLTQRFYRVRLIW